VAGLRLSAVTKRFGSHAVVHGIDLVVADGEFVVLVGPSGCGKSTLLRMIAGLEDVSGGELWVGDQLANLLTPQQRNMSMVFQS
jgi:multiple sugar transport system ATP-binding protein